jgi:NAD-dependent deacetylase
MTRRDEVSCLRELLAASMQVVAFTGAGISTESGIPDYRGTGGLWTRMQPIQFQDFLGDPAVRLEAWRRKAADRSMERARPNAGHLALVELFRRGKLRCVITQNVDGLHEASGLPPEAVIELHRNATYAHCLSCGKRYELEALLAEVLATDVAPACDACEGIVKTATISFGQTMPEGPMRLAEAATRRCDLMIAVGSSLQVYPAAGFPVLAKQLGARLVILNRDPTGLDAIADLVIHAEIGPTLSAAVNGNDLGGGV